MKKFRVEYLVARRTENPDNPKIRELETYPRRATTFADNHLEAAGQVAMLISEPIKIVTIIHLEND